MAPITPSPNRSSTRRAGRPRVRSIAETANSEPPRKKLRPVNRAPATTSRARPARRPVENTPATSNSRIPVTPQINISRRGPSSPQPRYGSTTSANAMAQGDGYKPREERSYEEFHPDLDIETPLMVFSSEDVDGMRRDLNGGTPTSSFGVMSTPIVDGGATPVLGEALQRLKLQGLVPSGEQSAPPKRKVGRPPRRPEYLLSGLGSPPTPRIMPAPTHNPKERLNLPKPSYREIETFAEYEKAKGVGINFVDKSMSNVGYQESDLFLRPEKTYIRGAESSIEEALDFAMMHSDQTGPGAVANSTVGRVEYDMDEQDEQWLEARNAVRNAEGVEKIRPAMFEIIVTQVEKAWHALEKRIPKPNPKPPQTHRPRSSSAAAVNGEAGSGEEQDSTCAVCDDGDCENTNAIVFCDGCDLAVHQECYGVPFIPEGQWLCRKCQLIGRNTPTCIFCPNIDGAFKQTNTSRWSHLLCAIWIPEVSLGNQTFMEPVMDVDKVPKGRWRLTCYICQQKMGACIQCSNKNCYLAFHVTCARRCRLFLKMKSPHGGIAEKSSLKGFCDKHVPQEWRKEHNVDAATSEAKSYYRRVMKGKRWADSQQSALVMAGPAHAGAGDGNDVEHDEENLSNAAKKKRAQQQKNMWRLPSGAPIVPHAVYHSVETAISRFAIRKRKEFVAEACKYWTLKREARRGAPLIKRLQLDTFSSMEIPRRNFAALGAAGGPKLQRRIEFAERIERDVEQISELCLAVMEREKLKLRDAELLKEIVDTVYFPIVPMLWPILERLQSLDANYKGYFREGLYSIQLKLEDRFYISVSNFIEDIATIFNQAIYAQSAKADESNSAEDALSHKSLTAEQKDKKSRAKRTLKLVQQLIMTAVQNEAELYNRNIEEDQARILSIMENCVRPGQAAGLSLSGEVESDDEAGGDGDRALQPITPNGVSTNGSEKDPRAEAHFRATFNDEAAAEDGDHPKLPNGHIEEGTNPTDSSDLVMNDRDNPSTSSGAETAHRPDSSTSPRDSSSAVPTLSNTGSTILSVVHPDPPTPIDAVNGPGTKAEQDQINGGGKKGDQVAANNSSDSAIPEPSVEGGIPWYLESFDPDGTTIYDERWTGRDVLRGLSEELSELDEDTLNGLVGEEELPDAGAGAKEAAAKAAVAGGAELLSERTAVVVSAAQQKKKPRPKRRRLR